MSELERKILEVEPGDMITLTTSEGEYTGYVTDGYHDELEYDSDGIPIYGSFMLSMDADNDTVESEELPSHAIRVHARAKRGGLTDWEVTVWDPVTGDDGMIVDDEYVDLGEPTAVEVESDDE